MGKVVEQFLSEVLDFKNGPVIVSIFLVSFLVLSFNFLPKEVLIKIKLVGFLERYSDVIWMSMLFSLFMLIVYFINKVKTRN